MRKTFPGYYRPTEDEFSELWDNCLFVLDANVLLNLYRYSRETREELIGILEEISDRLWVPHQAALEYHRNRLEVIEQQAAAYDKIQKLLNDAQKKLWNELRSSARPGRHPFIEVDHLLEKIAIVFTGIKEELKELKQEHPDLLDEDPIRDAIATLLEGKIGSPHPSERMNEIYKEGKTRYENKIPPGYSDADKGGTRQYGDLVLWFQVINKAKEAKKPIILITDDRKDDWWLRPKGQTIGPQPELVGEIVSKAGVSFYMYSADPFMEHARKYLERQVKQEAINEVRDVRQRDEEDMKAMQATAQIAEQLRAMQQLAEKASQQAAAFRIPDETLRALQQLAERASQQAAAFRIPDETLRALQQLAERASQQAAAFRIPDETLRTWQQAAVYWDEMLRAWQQAAVYRIPDEPTEDAIESSDIELDSESEGKPDESDDRADTGDE